MERIDPFELLPTELVTRIFCHLPTFSEALSAAATCRRFRQIWIENVTTVYQRIALRTTRCRRDARTLLADQGGAAIDSPVLSVSDVLRLVRNWSVLEHAIDKYNRIVVAKMRTTLKVTEFYGTDDHPPYLTCTERIRFIRSYYQVWSLILLDSDSKRERIENMTLKQLYPTREIATLEYNIGDEAAQASAENSWSSAKPWPPWEALGIRAEERTYTLPQMISRQLERKTELLHNTGPWDVGNEALYDGSWGRFVVMFDHSQEALKSACCGYFVKLPDEVSLWQDTSDEEE